jgi:cobalt-zinc-cadmium efflux system membrane fusion protein
MKTKRRLIAVLAILALIGGVIALKVSHHDEVGKDSHGGHNHEETHGKESDGDHNHKKKSEAKDEDGHSHDKEEKEAHGGHEHGHGEEGEHSDSTEIAKESAEEAGIKTAEAGPATIRETITLTSRITLNQNTTAEVKARFPGIVKEVRKGPGDQVSKDEVLATIESNTSLQVYPVKSPITGVILARNTSVGNVAGDSSIFTITNMADVWAEFHIFPRDVDRIKVGQKVSVTSFEGEHTGEAPITTLLPVAEASSQTVVARVTLPNPNKVWRAGMTVRGDVIVSERQVPLAVKTSAIQHMEGKTVVFVQEGERYEMRPIDIGSSDRTWTEVKSGIKPGEVYVTEKSFQVKADIGKAGAEHEH